jgi:hypothetical protein
MPPFEVRRDGSNGKRTVTRIAIGQILDNFTLTPDATMKFGGDYRYLTALYTMPSVRLPGRLFYTFNNSVTSVIGNPYAAFRLGVPDATTLDRCIQPNTEGYAGSYAFYGQDDWKVPALHDPLWWEYQPMFRNHRITQPSCGRNILR